MRGRRNPQITMLAFIDLEERIPTAHPLRTIKRLADEALADLSSVFDRGYAKDGRPSIPPERLLKHEVGQKLFDEVVGRAHARGLLSNEHFTVDGTLIEAATSLKSFKPKDGDPPTTDGDPGNPSVDFHGEKRSNETHQSATDGSPRTSPRIRATGAAPSTGGPPATPATP